MLERLGWPDHLAADARLGVDVVPLRVLNAIRVEQAHANAEAADLSTLGAEPRGAVSMWGEVLDRLYDSVTESLDDFAQLLEEVR